VSTKTFASFLGYIKAIDHFNYKTFKVYSKTMGGKVTSLG
jgi:hypothetical protein